MEMNYKKTHSLFIDYFKKTTPKQRLMNRNKMDYRLKRESLYVEKHHIVPKHFGGTDDPSNIVIVLPEEHLFIHKLRYKAFGLRGDMLAVRFIVNGLASKGYIRKCHKTSFELTKHIRNTYSWIKTNSSEFRFKHGWQTPEGKRNISKARTGKMPTKNAKTGETIGSIKVDHPKILSGEWVHVTKGRKVSNKEKKNRPCGSKENNNNYKTFANKEFLINFLIENLDKILLDELVFSQKLFNELLKKYVKLVFDKKIHGTTILKNRFGSTEKFIDQINQQCDLNIIFDPYYRSKSMKQKLGKKSSEYQWVTDGNINKRVKKGTKLLANWRKGRTNVTY